MATGVYGARVKGESVEGYWSFPFPVPFPALYDPLHSDYREAFTSQDVPFDIAQGFCLPGKGTGKGKGP